MEQPIAEIVKTQTVQAAPRTTPRASDTRTTPRASDIIRTPRGETDNQKKTLLLPNTIEELDEEDEEVKNGSFADLRDDVELRAAQGIADKILVTSKNEEKREEKREEKKKHRRSSDIEMEARVGRSHKSDEKEKDREDNEGGEKLKV